MTTTSDLLNATESSNSTLFDDLNSATTSTTLSATTTTLLTTTTTVLTTKLTTIITTVTTTQPVVTTTLQPEHVSYLSFLFCTAMLISAAALITKIIYSNRNKYRILNFNSTWRLSTSRSSASAQFVPTMDPFTSPARSQLGFGSAHYTAVAPTSNDHFAQAHTEWERQFFDDDQSADPERNTSRLELRRE